jgi:hypothetical protein
MILTMLYHILIYSLFGLRLYPVIEIKMRMMFQGRIGRRSKREAPTHLDPIGKAISSLEG